MSCSLLDTLTASKREADVSKVFAISIYFLHIIFYFCYNSRVGVVVGVGRLGMIKNIGHNGWSTTKMKKKKNTS